MSIDDPAASLALADTASRHLAGRTRWESRYYVLQAAHWIIWIPFFGLVYLPSALGPVSGLVGAFLFLLAIVGAGWLVDIWADRQGVVLRGSRRLRMVTWLVTAPLSGGAVFFGVSRSLGDPAFWIPAALVTATPSLVAAVLAGRAADPR